MNDTTPEAARETAPPHAGAVLATLILVAAIANLPLATANVALPSVGQHFDASQTGLNLVAVGYSLGLAASVLWLGALGDRHGRKSMLLAGVVISVPTSLLAAWPPDLTTLVVARIAGGVAAGMAYPTTLALITALWAAGPARTRAIALWSATGGAISSLGPLIAGLLLSRYWWGSVFLVTVPLVALGVPLAARLIPAHANESSDPVDNLGGILSAILVGATVLAINFVPIPGAGATVTGLVVVALAALVGFVIRQRRTPSPLYDLRIAARRVFWVAACAGIIVFGSLMGALFIGQQFLQNVLGYSTLDAGVSILPATVVMVLIAPRSAKLVDSRGSRFTLLVGVGFVLAGFLTMLAFWKEGASVWTVVVCYAFVGAGVGFAGTPASRSLTSSVPVARAGMASGTADLQRDLGGAIMQSIFGALLTAGYGATASRLIAGSPSAPQVTDRVQAELTKSFASAADTAARYPQYSSQIIEGARQAFADGQRWAYLAGSVGVLAGGALVYFLFPKCDAERQLLAQYHAEEVGAEAPTARG
ncbi:MFS transporter [Rhabdothermincola sediminis]|uniref:MFS transporter n=1 Tax=Rhabdothermincola sediminis TaxID=2751370 RepID=UPI001AA09BE6|nr:MFS transporter [Rhabdothermincola sediminis]